MNADEERPLWRAYKTQETDSHGYASEKFGVREEYGDGATRYIHSETMDTIEEAQLLASKFNMNIRKGKTYDNRMKSWE